MEFEMAWWMLGERKSRDDRVPGRDEALPALPLMNYLHSTTWHGSRLGEGNSAIILRCHRQPTRCFFLRSKRLSERSVGRSLI